MSTEAVKADALPDSDIRLKMQWRDPIATTVMAVLTVLIAFTTKGTVMVSWSGATSWFNPYASAFRSSDLDYGADCRWQPLFMTWSVASRLTVGCW